MNTYLNPPITGFQESVNSEIYVDKSELIAYTNKILGTKQKNICISRPRRFGKSMAAEMLLAYYSKRADSASLFCSLKIAASSTYLKHLNQYNVISVNMQNFLSTAHNARKMISELQNAIGTELAEAYDISSRFSGGQKQRICIARAILKNAPILILDEATSAADPENQVEIDRAIENLCRGKTVIIVAHRLGIVSSCDRIAVVEGKTVSRVGSLADMQENSPYFARAWKDYNAARNIRYQLKGGENA